MKPGENASAAAVYLPVAELRLWPKNPRKNDGAVEQIAASIARFGFAAPVVVQKSTGFVLCGNTRLKAARHLGLAEVPARVLDLSDAEAEALAIADNKLGELADWDAEALAAILRDLDAQGAETKGLGFTDDELARMLEGLAGEEGKDGASSGDGGEDAKPEADSPYTKKIKLPLYEPKGEKPEIGDLFDDSKAASLCAAIDASGVPKEIAAFLKHAAQRHTSFNFRQIAEYYCHAPPSVQRLMEDSGLVIIDFDKAIENGFVRLSERLAKLSGIDKSGREDDDAG